MSYETIRVGQLICDSTTPPEDRGFYKIDEKTTGVVGDLVFVHPVSGKESVPVRAVTSPGGGVELSAGALRVASMRSNQPVYVESAISLCAAGYGTPAGIASYADPFGESGYALSGFRVSGGAGETALTLNSGTVADIAGTWAAVIEHDDGRHRTYTVTGATGSTLNVQPPLASAVTRGRLYNMHDAVNGQHLTLSGARALAEHIYYYNPVFGDRQQYVARIGESDATGWSTYGGLSAGRLSHNQTANIHSNAGTNLLSTQTLTRNTKYVLCALINGGGCTKTWSVDGVDGYLETYVGVADSVSPARVVVLLDGRVMYQDDLYGCRRICVPFVGGSSLEMRVYGLATQAGNTRIGETTIWVKSGATSARMFEGGARVVWLGDSWTYRTGSEVVQHLGRLLAQDGGQAFGVGMPGQTSQWGIDNFSKAVACDPTDIIIEYFVNDRNANATDPGRDAWIARINTLIDMVQDAGARPIVLMPCQTGSQAQAQDLAKWASALAPGALLA